MSSQLVPGIFGLLQPILECRVHHVTLLAQVADRLGEDTVHQGLQRQGVVPLLVGLLQVGVGEVQPVFQTHRAGTEPMHLFTEHWSWEGVGGDKPLEIPWKQALPLPPKAPTTFPHRQAE